MAKQHPRTRNDKNIVSSLVFNRWIVTGMAVLLFLLGIWTNPLSNKHVLLNLEPYPDGLIYVNASQNIVQSHRFEVGYRGMTIKPYVTPLYAYALAIGALFTNHPQIFYWVNVAIGLVTILLFSLSLKQITTKNWLVALGLVLYLLHLYVLWLPSVPMAENLGLCFFMGALYVIVKREYNLWSVLTALLLLGGLIMTKYTFMGVAGVMGLFLLYRCFRQRQWMAVSLTISIAIVGMAAFLFYLLGIGLNPLNIIRSTQVNTSLPSQGIIFYSFRFLGTNIHNYTRMLLGLSTNFLWLQYPFTTFGMLGMFVVSMGMLFLQRKTESREMALFLVGLLFAQFPVLLIFYVSDARYIILSIPIFVMGIVVAGEYFSMKKWWQVACVAVFCIQLGMQLTFAKYLVATNWLQRSTPWQYEAVKVAGDTLQKTSTPEGKFLITALPPIYVQMYWQSLYPELIGQGVRLLPLSLKQEFAQKKQYIWGSDINYQDLPATYEMLLHSGQTVYYSNAYLSSQHEFYDQDKVLHERFTLKLLQTGCFDLCNVYQLELKKS